MILSGPCIADCDFVGLIISSKTPGMSKCVEALKGYMSFHKQFLPFRQIRTYVSPN